MSNTEQILASPMPGEMEGNEPDEVVEVDDQIPFPDVDEEIE